MKRPRGLATKLPIRRTIHVVGYVLAVASPLVTKARADDALRVWCWSPPVGGAAAHPALEALVRVGVSPTSDPRTAADAVCNEVMQRELTGDRVAITLQNFGRGTLIGNPLDAMAGTGLPEHLTRGTPWADNGIASMSAWTAAFI